MSPRNTDTACHFVGEFAFCARKQGWTYEEVQRVVRPVTAKRAYEQLMPFIEPVPFRVSPLSDRSERYADGCRLLAHDPDVKFRPFHWEIRPPWDAIMWLFRVK